jgi:hypothetical protein
MSKCPYLFYDNNKTYWCLSDNHPKFDEDKKQAYLSEEKDDIPAFCYNNSFENCPFYKKKTSSSSTIAVVKNKNDNQLPKRRIF